MEETVIVIMLKDGETGFLEKELGSYTLPENGGMVYNIYAEDTPEGDRVITLRLTCDRQIADWEYEAIFDYYDMEPMEALIDQMEEEDGHFDPIWVVKFHFVSDYDALQDKLMAILEIHKSELLSVYDVIADKEDDYIEK